MDYNLEIFVHNANSWNKLKMRANCANTMLQLMQNSLFYAAQIAEASKHM